MNLQLGPGESIQIIANDLIYTFVVSNGNNRTVMLNGIPLNEMLRQYKPPVASEQFVEEHTKTKHIKPDKF